MSIAPLGFAEALAAFEQHLYGRGRSQATVHTYASALRVFATLESITNRGLCSFL
jgi:hypothetical protein